MFGSMLRRPSFTEADHHHDADRDEGAEETVRLSRADVVGDVRHKGHLACVLHLQTPLELVRGEVVHVPDKGFHFLRAHIAGLHVNSRHVAQETQFTIEVFASGRLVEEEVLVTVFLL